MILRNGVEIKKINEEFSRLNLLIGEMRKSNVSRNELINLQSQIESGLLKIATYMDKIDKVWVNKNKMRNVYTDYNSLIGSYNQAKLQIAKAGHTVDYGSTDALWLRSETKMASNVSYLNNANNSRTKDRIHYFATRGLALVLAGALMVGGAVALNKYNDMKGDYDNQVIAGEQLKTENEQLQEDIKNLQDQIADLEKKLENAGSPEEAEQLRAEIAELKAQLSEMISLKEYNELLAAHEKTQDELDDARAEVESLKEQLKNAGSSEAEKELREKLEKAEAKVAELEGKLANYDALITENATLRSEKAALESSLADANSRIADLEKQLEEARKNNDSKRIEELENLLQETYAAKATVEKSLEEANKKIGKLEEEIKKVNAENASLKAENDKLKEENEEGDKVINSVDATYEKLFGNDGAGLTASDKLAQIIEYLNNLAQSTDGVLARQAMVEFIVNTHLNSPGFTFTEVNTWSDEQIVDEFFAIVGKYANAGDGPANSDVKEEVQTPSDEEEKKDEEEKDPISPDFGNVFE